MSVPTDDSPKSHKQPTAAETSTATSGDAETAELSPEELQKVSGGSPHTADWIKGTT